MSDFNDENINAAEKLKKLGHHLRCAVSDLNPISKEHLMEARNEILEMHLQRLEDRLSDVEAQLEENSQKEKAKEHDHKLE